MRAPLLLLRLLLPARHGSGILTLGVYQLLWTAIWLINPDSRHITATQALFPPHTKP